MPKFALIGPWGNNLGDMATIIATLDYIKEFSPGAEIVCFSLVPYVTEQAIGINCLPAQRPVTIDPDHDKNMFVRFASSMQRNPNSLIRELGRWVLRAPIEFQLIQYVDEHLRDVDALIINGGGQLEDEWGGPFSHPYTLLKFSFIARLHKKKVFILSVGAGPIRSRISKIFIKQTLGLANYCSYRDLFSKQLIESIGFHRDDPVYPDLAWKYKVGEFIPKPTKSVGLKVGIGAMVWRNPQIWPTKDQSAYNDYISRLAEFCAWLLRNGHQISMIPGEPDHDLMAIADVKSTLAKMGIPDSEDKIITTPIHSVPELLNELSTLDAFVGSRFHNLLFSLMMNVPTLAIPYHKKLNGVLDDIGIGHYWMPIESFNLDMASSLFNDMMDNKPEILSKISKRLPEIKAALDEQFAKTLSTI
jgi:polysaccharide pyruvyl transferase WcaK-like protein